MKTKEGKLPWQVILGGLIVCVLANACQPTASTALGMFSTTPSPTPIVTETGPATYHTNVTETPTSAPDPTPRPIMLWLPVYLPDALRDSLEIRPGFAIAEQEEGADLKLEVVNPAQQPVTSTPWVYALVAPFPTIRDEISLEELLTLWRSGVTGTDGPKQILVDEATHAIFEILWGPSSSNVKTMPAGQLLKTAWQQPDEWAIIPFEQIQPQWKVLIVDGQSPVQKNFNPLVYGLVVHFGLKSKAGNEAETQIRLPEGNRRSDRLTTVILTGVTALVRGTASYMEGRGMTYPAQDIGGWLREADILHINNEVPFARNCPQPFNWEGLVFCSQTEYIELLESIGTDVVELSGDHFQDWGPEATYYTIDLYDERGWKYYGGGRDISDAQKPALFEHNGNKIAFIGCNAKPVGYSGASETTPGAVHCDFDQMTTEIGRLRKVGYLPIVTFQHLEYYSYPAHPILQEDFQKVAEAGAVIVSGSQAHQPHAFAFKNGALLHYGLGNLFFDQTNQGEPPRTAFIDRHVFYDGQHISTELLTIYFVDYARSRPMTIEERQSLLQTVFDASEWDTYIP